MSPEQQQKHTYSLVMGRALKKRARALKVELEPGPSLGPSEKVKPDEPLIFTP